MFLVCSRGEPAYAHAPFCHCGEHIHDMQSGITAGGVEARAKGNQGNRNTRFLPRVDTTCFVAQYR